MGIRKSIFGAVLTGDIVNSTKLLPQQESALIKKLSDPLEQFLGQSLYEFYRGDSFQVFMEEPGKALQLALACRALAISISARGGEEEPTVRSDIRISIGIGEATRPVRNLGLAKGDAFLLSGRQLDQLQQSEDRLAIGCMEPMANIGFQILADYLDSIYKGMTAKQADLIVELLSGTTQQQAALRLDKSKSTVSQLASAGRWPEIERLLKQYEMLINQLLS